MTFSASNKGRFKYDALHEYFIGHRFLRSQRSCRSAGAQSCAALQNEGLEEYLTREGYKLLAEFAKRIGANKREQIVVSSTRTATHAIVEYAKEQDINLIVVGSHGKHGIDVLLGSTANGVMHRAPCDVLAVRIDSAG